MIKLVIPNTNPKIAPFFGPNVKAPIMTGMWIIVALVNPRGIYPRNGVKAMMMISAAKSATLGQVPVSVALRLSLLDSFFFLLVIIPLRDTIQLLRHYSTLYSPRAIFFCPAIQNVI